MTGPVSISTTRTLKPKLANVFSRILAFWRTSCSWASVETDSPGSSRSIGGNSYSTDSSLRLAASSCSITSSRSSFLPLLRIRKAEANRAPMPRRFGAASSDSSESSPSAVAASSSAIVSSAVSCGGSSSADSCSAATAESFTRLRIRTSGSAASFSTPASAVLPSASGKSSSTSLSRDFFTVLALAAGWMPRTCRLRCNTPASGYHIE